MINKSMFYGEPTIKDYRDINVLDIMKEYLLSQGTRGRDIERNVTEINHKLLAIDLIPSGLFVYGLKANATNKQAVKYYCERFAHINQLWEGKLIKVPDTLWAECDKKNEEFTNGNDRK